jgi:hypothetical protein
MLMMSMEEAAAAAELFFFITRGNYFEYSERKSQEIHKTEHLEF